MQNILYIFPMEESTLVSITKKRRRMVDEKGKNIDTEVRHAFRMLITRLCNEDFITQETLDELIEVIGEG